MKNSRNSLWHRLALGTSALCMLGGVASAQDLIVRGSLCAGLDCVTGESFGSDTIRLKENNLRIHFDDTSATASFPSNDWRLTANDDSNGGISRFSIDDATAGRSIFTVEAGAPIHSLYVDNVGRIGAGLKDPVVEFHVRNGDSPTLRLEQDGSSGFQSQTWDLAGNETNFFVRDVSNGSLLPFKIRPGADTNALVIDPDGDISMLAGVNPSASLHLRRTDGTAQVLLQDTGGSGPRQLVRMENDGAVQLYMDNTANASAQWLFSAGASMIMSPSENAADAVFDLASNGNLQIDGTLTQSSDKHRKMAIEPVDPTEILAKVRTLPVSEWTYKHDAETGIRHIGPMAQDFYAAFGTGADDKGISSLDSGGVALAAIQALSVENSDLLDRIEALEEKVQAD